MYSLLQQTDNGNSESSLVNIGERLEIEQYADSEWKGQTQKATLLRQVN